MRTSTATLTRTTRTATAPTLNRIRMVMLADEELNANPRSWMTGKSSARARRLARFGRTWIFVGVLAEAEILTGNCVQRISSGGVWGIESDAHNVLKEVGAEQFDELREILAAIGIAVEVPFASLTWGER
jgi:hypothetical protein